MNEIKFLETWVTGHRNDEDIEYRGPFTKQEVEDLAYRGDFIEKRMFLVVDSNAYLLQNPYSYKLHHSFDFYKNSETLEIRKQALVKLTDKEKEVLGL